MIVREFSKKCRRLSSNDRVLSALSSKIAIRVLILTHYFFNQKNLPYNENTVTLHFKPILNNIQLKRLIITSILVLSQLSIRAFTIALTGDIMMGTTTAENQLPQFDGALLFWNVSPIIKSADFAMCNLEGTLCDTDPKPRQCKDSNIYYVFKTPQRYVWNLTNAGFDAVSIANNHINDFGSEGRDSTMSTLQRAGIAYSGLWKRCETATVIRKGKRIGICSFSHNSVTVDIRNIVFATKLVRSMRHTCDYLIVSFHGGSEGRDCMHVTREEEFCFGQSRGNVYEFAHACIDAGADLVFGHGPHVPRGLELYKNHLIAYSLGNFCTPYGIVILGTNGYAPLLIVEIDNKGSFIKGKIESYVQRKGNGPTKDNKERAAKLIKQLSVEDFPESNLLFSKSGNRFWIKQ